MPKTIENCRVPEETIVLPDDEETLQDKKADEFSTYFDRRVTPKVLVTSADKPSLKTHLFMRELSKCIPNSEVRLRKSTDIKKIVVQAVEREYTDILVVNEDRKLPNGLLIIHLPEGPTAHFKVTSFKRGYDIKVCPYDYDNTVRRWVNPACTFNKNSLHVPAFFSGLLTSSIGLLIMVVLC